MKNTREIKFRAWDECQKCGITFEENTKKETMNNYEIVPEDKAFTFKAACPYCGGNLTYTANGWEQDDDGLWMADTFDCECSNEPDIESDEWEDWMQQHSEMPYVYQLPIDEKVKEVINSKYRFELT